MEQFPLKPVDVYQLSQEIDALNLPGKGPVRAGTRIGSIQVEVGRLNAAQKTALSAVVANHVPVPEKTRRELIAEGLDAATTLDEAKAVMAKYLR